MNKVCGPTRIILYIIIFLLGLCILVYGLYRIASWMNHLSCGDSKTSQTVYLHPDSTDQHKIDSIQHAFQLKDDSIAVLNYILDTTEQIRSEVETKYITRTKIIEITNASELYTMNRFWLSPGRIVTGKTYPFDSLDMMSLAKKHAEYDYYKSDRELLLSEKSTYEKKINFMSGQLSDKDKIISLKDDQIHKMENTPVNVASDFIWDRFNISTEFFLPVRKGMKLIQIYPELGAMTGINYKDAIDMSGGVKYDVSRDETKLSLKLNYKF